jgi:hypothetical protein
MPALGGPGMPGVFMAFVFDLQIFRLKSLVE